MKRHGNLYSKIYSMDNIKLAHKNAKKGKSNYSEVKLIELEPEKHFKLIYNMLKNKTFKNSKYTVFTKVDKGKEREIFKLPYFPDRIVHHCIMNVVEPIWMKTFISDTYSSLKNRGIHKGVKRVKKALKDVNDTKYCLKMDIKKYYPSINHSVLKRIIRKKIKDIEVLYLLDLIIDSANGIPIGNYVSQFSGNLYLSDFDHWAKEQKHCKYYFRYCDDFVILHKDKVYLSNLRKEISIYLKTNLKLKLKSNWQVFPTNIRGIDFLGYRFFHNYTLLRKSIVVRFKQRVKQIKKGHYHSIKLSARSCIMSYFGWMKFANCNRLKRKYIDDCIKLTII